MPPQIAGLLLGEDWSEKIRDQIAGILLLELEHQRELAPEVDPPQDPALWDLRIFTEHTNPWEEFLPEDVPDAEGEPIVRPIVNVCVESVNYDSARSTPGTRQRAIATYNIDCYGYGASSNTDEGHDPGDRRSRLEAQRAARLVRRILMSGHYVQLGLPGLIGKRFIRTLTAFMPSIDVRPVQPVVPVRLQLDVEFNEFSPEYVGQPLEIITISIERAGTNEVYLVAQYGESTPP